jgi:hypothetical protein
VQLIVIRFNGECVHINEVFSPYLWMKFIDNVGLAIKYEPFISACCLASVLMILSLLHQLSLITSFTVNHPKFYQLRMQVTLQEYICAPVDSFLRTPLSEVTTVINRTTGNTGQGAWQTAMRNN